jgi:hypothetical protein
MYFIKILLAVLFAASLGFAEVGKEGGRGGREGGRVECFGNACHKPLCGLIFAGLIGLAKVRRERGRKGGEGGRERCKRGTQLREYNKSLLGVCEYSL